ncbi:MAG TPA: adenylosuccinate synthase [Dehalococcoidales bacterium]|nr:adenylosuccinate synthase [Dehalococcoidales bacterium]
MPVIAIIGAQWGDEGKGKIVDLLAEQADMVVRFSGGDNAGHTVVNQLGEFKLHLIPSGIFSAKATSIIGNGVVVNPRVLLNELDALKQRGVDTSRLFISDRAHLVMPYHLLLDGLEEEARGSKAIGTTRKGIGPAFADKVARLGIRTSDLLDKEIFRERLHTVLAQKNTILTRVYNADPLSEEEVFSEYCRYGEILAPQICDTTALLEKAINDGKHVMLEGAQGTLLDPDFGTYPYATSSSPLAGGGCLGAGLGPTKIDQVLGIFKAYCTRVGGGPMPTELKDEIGASIRECGHEYGTTTGRPRRCGWFDAVASRFSTRVNGYTQAAITRLDVLDTQPALKICTGYEVDGKKIDNFPASAAMLEKCRPVYEELPGWQTPINDIRDFAQLPPQARQYLSRLEELIACPISVISVGMRREQTIFKRPIL